MVDLESIGCDFKFIQRGSIWGGGGGLLSTGLRYTYTLFNTNGRNELPWERKLLFLSISEVMYYSTIGKCDSKEGHLKCNTYCSIFWCVYSYECTSLCSIPVSVSKLISSESFVHGSKRIFSWYDFGFNLDGWEPTIRSRSIHFF